ncbi:MAG TPA: hypothetical protein VND97_09085 [Beijerinckiaceae bacterium]|nr:hypothetical protein [Beijerinckiaceae bacterium]
MVHAPWSSNENPFRFAAASFSYKAERVMDATGEIGPQPPAFLAPAPSLVIALVGLTFEARIAANRDVLVLCGKKGRDHLLSQAVWSAQRGCRAIVSFGVAGGLAPHLRPGDVIVASAIHDEGTLHPTDRLRSELLLKAIPHSNYSAIAGVDAPVVDPRGKRELNARTGAVAIDMESHLVARMAAARGVAFVAIRVIVDPAERVVPSAALAAMRPDGSTSICAVLSGLMAEPRQAKAMARIALDLYAARSSLVRVRQLLGRGFGLSDLD